MALQLATGLNEKLKPQMQEQMDKMKRAQENLAPLKGFSFAKYE